ncbi:hypothetical protein UlMin_008105 [Ulmus minor]
MEESEKLTALKKAYADIILNTAKEAAARILVSERKALRFQRELFSAKEEALRMLTRLKLMLDSKDSEAQMISSSQQRKIEELEAQLEEAVEIVRDLRAELSEVQDELEKAKNNQAAVLDEKNLQGEIATNENGSVSSEPISQLEPATNSEMKSNLNGLHEGNKSHNVNDNANDSHVDHCRDNPGFASLVMGRKEPELYKNGCTQRIRASERNLLDDNLSLSGLVDDAKNGTFIRRDEEGKPMPISPTSKSEFTNEPLEDSDELKVKQVDNSHIQMAFKSFRRKRKRAARHRKFKPPSSKHLAQEVAEIREVSDLTCSTASPSVNGENRLDSSSEKIADEVLENRISPSSPKSPTGTTEMSKSGCADPTEGNLESFKPCSLLKVIGDDKASVDKSELTKQESLLAEALEVSACEKNVEKDNEVGKLDSKVSERDDGIASQPENNRFLKYTFTRKRKKGSLSSPDDHKTSKRQIGEKENSSLDPQSSSLPPESSRDNRRLAQVARQLISLSEKKWW